MTHAAEGRIPTPAACLLFSRRSNDGRNARDLRRTRLEPNAACPPVQKLLTEYGCNIKTRLGLHHVDEKGCSVRGLILLEMFGDPAVYGELKAKLAALDGVEVQEMVFEHDD